MFDSFVAEQIESIVILHYRKALQVIEGLFYSSNSCSVYILMYVLLFCAVINSSSTSINAIKNYYKPLVNVSRETFYFDKVFH